MTECVMVVSATGGYRGSSKELTTPDMLTNNWTGALVNQVLFVSSPQQSSDINHLTKKIVYLASIKKRISLRGPF